MLTTREDIAEWFRNGVELGATHLIVVVDTFEYEDYPVYVKSVPESTPTVQEGYQRVTLVHDVRTFVRENYSGQNMQKTMEVYNLSLPMEPQINTPLLTRTFNY